MQRQTLIFNGIPYLVDYIKSTEMLIKTSKKYVMLRKYDIVNEIAIDKNIYFIAIDDYKEALKVEDNQIVQTNKICYPILKDKHKSFSSNIISFMDSSRLSALLYNGKDKDYYILRGRDGEPLNIRCDEIRIYKPHNRKLLPGIIHISNIINDIQFNYFCQLYENQPVSVCPEVKHENNTYYEYISFYIPALDYLFDKDIVKYNEDLNIMQYADGFRENNLASVSDLLLPYKIEKFCYLQNECIDCPLYQPFEEEVTITPTSDVVEISFRINNLFSFVFRKNINSTDNEIREVSIPNSSGRTCTYSAMEQNRVWKLNEPRKILIKKTGFVDIPITFEVQSISGGTISKMSFRDNAKFCEKVDLKNVFIKSFQTKDILSDQYVNTDYNHKNVPLIISLNHYDMLDDSIQTYLSTEGLPSSSLEIVNDNKFTLATRIGFDYNNKSIISVISEFKYPKIENEDGTYKNLEESYFYLNKIDDPDSYYNFEGYDDEIFLDNFSDEFIESLKFNSAGYVIEMAKDRFFDQIFYRRSCATKVIDDFTFNINGIFDSWKEYPEVIFIRTMFIDKYLSKVFYGNVVVLDKEKFKYCINDTVTKFRLNGLVNLQKSIERKMQVNDIYFIDKINCSINKHDVNAENVIYTGGSVNQKVVYKTVFYKVQDLQSIRIRSNVTQKIGINLSNYLTRVENFKMKLDGYEFVETERNDTYIIFTIPGSQIKTLEGKYDIVNDEDEYIASGNYILY